MIWSEAVRVTTSLGFLELKFWTTTWASICKIRERALGYQSSEVTFVLLYCFAEASFLVNSSASFGTDTLDLVSLYFPGHFCVIESLSVHIPQII